MPLSPSAPFRTTAGAWAVAAAVSLLFIVGLATAPIATADTCDNATLRAQNNSTALPDCRAYEMVSQPYKGGFRVFAPWGVFTDDGVVRYGSLGSFAGNGRSTTGNAYNATRSAAGWMSTSLAAPDAILDSENAGPFGESADLRWALTAAKRRAVPGDPYGFWLRDPDGGFTRVGDALEASGEPRIVIGWSQDLSHVVFHTIADNSTIGAAQLYEYVGTDNGATPRTVSADNHGNACGGPNFDTEISPDARVITFMSNCSGASRQVWARVAGSATVAASGSECTRSAGDPGGVCNDVSDAAYAGRSADGSRVFFTTSQQLVNGDVDQTSDLYACDIPPGVPAPVGAANPCATLTQVSGTVSGAQVASVPAVSGDGSRAYFVADGAALADNLGVNDAPPVAGQPNLYLWTKDAAHPAGDVTFVAKLDTNDLAGNSDRSQSTSDGRYLLFVTANQLVKTGLGADNDLAKDAYRYDAVTHTIVRLSTSVSGSGGNDPAGSVLLVAVASSMTADGSTVIFDTAEGLSAADTNGVTDVYSWRDGQVSLISAGGGASLGITPSGRDIFFKTNAQVVAADGDVHDDIYDARLGGGFAVAWAVPPCSGDGCQGQRSQSPPLAGPSAPTTTDGDIRLGQRSLVSLKRVSARRLRAASRTGVLSVRVTSSSAGRLSVSARASSGRVAGKTVRVRKAGTVKVRLSLSSDARRRLRSGRPLRVTLSVTKQGARTRSRSVLLPGASS